MTALASQPTNTDLPCRVLCSVKAELGEGLLWDAQRKRLLMTDIRKGRLLEIDIDSSVTHSWEFDQALAWVLKTQREGVYVLGFQSGLALFNVEQPSILRWINQDFPSQPGRRLNDACADAQGQIWYGSMNSTIPWSQDGQLASFTLGQGVRIHDSDFAVTNGPVVSPDGLYLYFNDTLQGTVYRYRLSASGGDVSEREVFAQFDSTQGYPDGMCFDTQGHLWIALWGAASLAELNPEGHLLRRVPVPAKNVTNVCFGGPDLDRLIVSTAAIEMSPEEDRRYPGAGDVFEVMHHGRIGLPPHSVILDPSWI